MPAHFARRLLACSLTALAALASTAQAAPLAIRDRLPAAAFSPQAEVFEWVQQRGAVFVLEDWLDRLPWQDGVDHGLLDASGHVLALVNADAPQRLQLGGGFSDEVWLSAGLYRFGALSRTAAAPLLVTPVAQAVPEPGSLALAGCALVAVGGVARRTAQRRAAPSRAR